MYSRFCDFSLVKAYAEGRANIVFGMRVDPEPAEYYLVFGAIVDRVDRRDVMLAESIVHGNYYSSDSYGDKLFMPAVAELVHGPKGIIRSLVWLERAEDGDNGFRDINANFAAHDEVVEFVGAIRDGELRPLRVCLSRDEGGSGVSTLVERKADGFKGLGSEKRAMVRQSLTELEFKKAVAAIIRIELTDQI